MAQLQILMPILQEFRQELAKFYGKRLVKLILFGSQARGNANEDSDIDIMVVLKGPISPGDEVIRMADIATQLDLKYNTFISLIPIADEDFVHRQTPLMDNIRREGIVL
ncbi:MAG: nucleotidyltransferase domain-containing protein [Microcystis sp. M54BS1]|jgi:predicted nucleotidyltransferase|uniref:Polymerase nucleotidyl transferase domain-containing protein n=5 Tax=Microcystis TaxID=1125 RepID=A0A5A5RPT2_MICAE|nr:MULTISPECIES: nucleotidyltransferase domain-containing protein [Microcystis]MBE5232089.1 nucleotidyltransferase domain-containing protein [Microcystis aeruginosa PMC 728.11]MCA2539061.1 nucleotidyltransferase domain-containing protein [Microcystis sp. M54BS1]MCA2610632.1 nucleotidyltransferase domain-containing protein [Microcystis sp. M27BS1]NCR42641.1 nucleotidyltransferase domain-containing protein [Microcystis aeruginosa W13-11]NCS31634.1 nucleotidyltransferase domain-containing protein